MQVGLQPDVACKLGDEDYQSWQDGDVQQEGLLKDACLRLAVQQLSFPPGR